MIVCFASGAVSPISKQPISRISKMHSISQELFNFGCSTFREDLYCVSWYNVWHPILSSGWPCARLSRIAAPNCRREWRVRMPGLDPRKAGPGYPCIHQQHQHNKVQVGSLESPNYVRNSTPRRQQKGVELIFHGFPPHPCVLQPIRLPGTPHPALARREPVLPHPPSLSPHIW